MIYTGYEFLWLFLSCSFLGWLTETVLASVKQKQFVNKGLGQLPFCIFYGIVPVFFSVFGMELEGIWVYVGAAIMALSFKWMTGKLLESLSHKKWWDYSGRFWNLDGYVSAFDTMVLALIAVFMMKWGNSLLIKLFHLLPKVLSRGLIWTALTLLILDISIDVWNIRRQVKLSSSQEAVFAYGCCFHKLVWIFVIGSFLGDVAETIFCRIKAGVWMRRSSLVWGTFSIVWGFGFVVATTLLHKYKERSDRFLFVIGTCLGRAYEYVCSVLSELVFGVVFWDYSDLPFNLGGRINLLYCFFWGIAAVLWIKHLYPWMSGWIERIPVKTGKCLTWILTIFMCCNMTVSGLALIRSDQRVKGLPAEQGWQMVMDERFDDERLLLIYPNMQTAD